MKKIFFRFLALFVPSRKLRRKIRKCAIDHNAVMLESCINIIKGTTDFSKITPANGIARLVQETNLKLLAAFDKFCTENGIEYCLIGGAIIGKIRHNGLIPWDDDIDVAIIGDSWHKLLKLLEEKKLGPDFYIRFGTAWNILKLCHKPTETFIDIFRFEYLDAPVDYIKNHAEYTARKGRYLAAHKECELSLGKHGMVFIRNSTPDQKRPELFNRISNTVKMEEDLFDAFVRDNHEPVKNAGIAHFSAVSKPNEVFAHDTIFPIQRIEFEGRKFPFPNNLNDYAFVVWGDIWCFPSKFVHHQETEPDIAQYFKMREFTALSDQAAYEKMFQYDQKVKK